MLMLMHLHQFYPFVDQYNDCMPTWEGRKVAKDPPIKFHFQANNGT